MKGYHVAVVGATGLVGQTILEILIRRKFPVNKLTPLASADSAGEKVEFNGKQSTVIDLATFDFSGVDIAFFSAGKAISAQYVPQATAAGAVVIDNTSQFRYQTDIPLIIPEVNADALRATKDISIIANPNCSTIQMLMAIKPINDLAKINKICVSTYQSVSGAGRAGIDVLASQTTKLLSGRSIDVADYGCFASQIAFNAIPQVDEFIANNHDGQGYTREEMKMVWETHKILANDNISIEVTAVRIPVFYGHSEAIYLETEQPLELPVVIDALKQADGLKVIEQADNYPTAIDTKHTTDQVQVGRIRPSLFSANGINLWVVGDNIRKGGAQNSVQIAEWLDKYYF